MWARFLGLSLLLLITSACSLNFGANVNRLGAAGGSIDNDSANDTVYVDADSDLPHLPYDAQGWTIFPTDYDISVFVDPIGGNDANWHDSGTTKGNTVATPIATLHLAFIIANNSAYATKSMRIMLRRGSVFNEDEMIDLRRGGTADHPFLLSGTDWGDKDAGRAHIRDAIHVTANTGAPLSHLAFSGIEVNPNSLSDAVDPSSSDPGIKNYFKAGLLINQTGTDYLVEDCVISHWFANIQFGGSTSTPIDNFRVRRSQISYATYAPGDSSAANGIGNGKSAKRILVEDSLFDMNGVPGSLKGGDIQDETTWPYLYADGQMSQKYIITAKEIISSYDSSNFISAYGAKFPAEHPELVHYFSAQAHDVYFVISEYTDTNGVRILQTNVEDVRFRRNLFTRTSLSQKQASSGVMDNNLFYAYQAPGYVGPHGYDFTNNVLLNGTGSFEVDVDNQDYYNHDKTKVERIYNNLFTHGKGMASNGGASLAFPAAGINLDISLNVLDDTDDGIYKLALYPWQAGCYKLSIHDNLFNINGNAYYFHTPDDCDIESKNNTFATSQTANGAKLLQVLDESNRKSNYTLVDLKTTIKADGDVVKGPASFSDPRRGLGEYLGSVLPQTSQQNRNLQYMLKLWRRTDKNHINIFLNAGKINDYLRAGHDMRIR